MSDNHINSELEEEITNLQNISEWDLIGRSLIAKDMEIIVTKVLQNNRVIRRFV
jgi:hypothetical protein